MRVLEPLAAMWNVTSSTGDFEVGDSASVVQDTGGGGEARACSASRASKVAGRSRTGVAATTPTSD